MPNSFRPEKAVLSDYERKILAVFSGGKTTKEIADDLSIDIDSASFLEGLARELNRSLNALNEPVSHGQSVEPEVTLTPRQREILGLIAKGMTSKEIAASLHISVKTVENHRKQIMERLNVRNFASLILVAVRLGLISLDE
jgi:DNA-binding CsgD family transcriptional regulator